MIAAVHARKSTDQSGVADEQKSVARQIEHARKTCGCQIGCQRSQRSVIISQVARILSGKLEPATRLERVTC